MKTTQELIEHRLDSRLQLGTSASAAWNDRSDFVLCVWRVCLRYPEHRFLPCHDGTYAYIYEYLGHSVMPIHTSYDTYYLMMGMHNELHRKGKWEMGHR
jgi:hypothetical protein